MEYFAGLVEEIRFRIARTAEAISPVEHSIDSHLQEAEASLRKRPAVFERDVRIVEKILGSYTGRYKDYFAERVEELRNRSELFYAEERRAGRSNCS